MCLSVFEHTRTEIWRFVWCLVHSWRTNDWLCVCVCVHKRANQSKDEVLTSSPRALALCLTSSSFMEELVVAVVVMLVLLICIIIQSRRELGQTWALYTLTRLARCTTSTALRIRGTAWRRRRRRRAISCWLVDWLIQDTHRERERRDSCTNISLSLYLSLIGLLRALSLSKILTRAKTIPLGHSLSWLCNTFITFQLANRLPKRKPFPSLYPPLPFII